MNLLKRNKSFAYLWSGRLFSNAGDSLYYVVLSWYLIETTKNPFWVGLINFAIFIPNIFAFLLGHTIDKSNKKYLLIILEIGQAFFLLILIIMMYLKYNNPILIAVVVFLIASFGMNTYTVQDAMIPIIVKENDLTKANQYMSVAYNTSDYLFNAITGVLIKYISTIPLLFIDLITFIISIFSFSRIDYKEVKHENIDENRDLLYGFKLIYKNKYLLATILLSCTADFMFGGLAIYQLLIAKNIGDSVFYGLLLATMSIGVLVGNIYGVKYILKFFEYGKAMIMDRIFIGISLFILSFTVNSYVVLLCFFMFGFFLGISHVLNSTFIQIKILKKDLGRFYSTMYTIVIPCLPLGSLFFGALALFISSRLFMIIFGFVYAISGVILYRYKEIREFMGQ